MAHCSRRQTPQTVLVRTLRTELPPEPEMRRWPHPVECPAPAADPAQQYLYCSLSYQNQLLSEIKTLLEQLAGAEEET